ncbi:MAG: MFS transporter [Candidatus Kariarchaeaceae archaeon]|jgi:MFS family permease
MLVRYFSRFGDSGKAVFSLFTASIVLNLGFGIMIPFIPTFALQLGASVTIIGFIIAAFTVGRAMIASSAGAYSDKIGRKRVMLFGTLVYALSTASMALVNSWQALMALRLLEGIAVGIVWPTAQAHLIDIVPSDKIGEATGVYTTTFSLGFFLGPLLGSTAYYTVIIFGGDKFQAIRAPFYLTGFLALCAALLIYKTIHDAEVVDKSTDKSYPKADVLASQVKRSGIANPRSEYQKYYIIAFLNGVGIGFIIPIFTIFFIEVHNFDEGMVGLILGISGGIMSVMAAPSGFLADKYGRKPLMLLSVPLMVTGTILLGFAGSIVMAASFFWIRSIGNGIYMPSFRSLQADVVLPVERGAIFGRTQTWFNIGAVFGPIIGTYVYEQMINRRFSLLGGKITFIGEATPFILTGLLQLLMLIVVLQLQFPKKDTAFKLEYHDTKEFKPVTSK